MKLTHVRLLVTDLDACFRFYRDVMGFEVVWGAEGEGYADFKTGDGTMIALFDRQAMSEEVGTTDLPLQAEAQDRFVLTFEAGDLDALARQLKERGANIVNEPRDFPGWGIRAAHLRDPEGNLIEINSPLPHEQWTEGLREEAEQYEGQE